jgi:hypothetical protein
MASYGTVYLNGIQFDLDPEDLTILGGHRHGSVHHLVSGPDVYQDRGFDITHATLELSGTFINASTITAFATLYSATTAVSMSWTDWMGNALTVIFTPGQDSFVVKPIRGAANAWTFTMSLRVISATSWNGISNPT